jgi:nucleotide-binding universal stress UspA family protein
MEKNMDMVKVGGKILVGWDGSMSSNAALDKATEIAKASKAAMTVLYVYYDPSIAKSDKMIEMTENSEADVGNRVFRDIEMKLSKAGVDYDFRTDEGNDEAKAITRMAEAEDYDLIVVGAGVKRAGSVADRISAGKKVKTLVV